MQTVTTSIFTESISILKQCIDSVLNQSYQDFEYLICLDYPSRKEVIKLLQDYQQKDSRIKFFINDRNLGIPSSLNFLLSKAKGEYIFRQDADDYSDPKRFEKQLSYIKQHNIDICASGIIGIDLNGKILGYTDLNNNYNNTEYISRFLRHYNIMAHSTWCVKNSVYKQLNGYRQLCPAEDYDFLCRAVNHGFTVGIINEHLVYYRSNPYGISSTNYLKQYALSYIIKKYFKNIENLSQEFILKETDRIMRSKNYPQIYQNIQMWKDFLANNQFLKEILYLLYHLSILPFALQEYKLHRFKIKNKP